MFIIYDLIISLFALIYLPIYLFKRKFHPGFEARLGILPQDLKLDRPIWLHAVSVGEAMAAKNIIKELRLAYPGKKFFMTTVTPTGNKIARAFSAKDDFVSYLPLDLSFIVKKTVDKVLPCMVIIMETEIWPNLISYFYKMKIPVALVNTRLSDRSFKGYLGLKFLTKGLLNKVSLFCAQTGTDAKRLIRLGVDPEKVKVTGNMKFDSAYCDERKLAESKNKYLALLGMGKEDKFWVCGSTHPKEEEIILDAYREILGEAPGMKLLIAPRHPERAADISGIVSRFGFRPVLVSKLPVEPCACVTKPVFILDSVGELLYYYNIASIVFVGGSLVKKGGHNILEPACLGKPVVTGPYMFNFRDIASLFAQNAAYIQIHDAKGLAAQIIDLSKDPDKGFALARRGSQVISQNRGAALRSLELISKLHEKGEQK